MGYLETELDCMLLFLEDMEKKYDDIVRMSPEGALQCNRRYGTYTYSQVIHVPDQPGKVSDPSGKHPAGYRRTGITRNEELIRGLAGKEYANCALKRIRRSIQILKRAKAGLMDVSPEAIYASMRSAYRTLPKSFYEELTMDEKMAEYDRWGREPFRQSDYRPEERTKRTSYGWCVRTKAEQLIVEKLFERRIRPRYEQVIHIGGYDLAPDFTFPDKHGQQFYWEYCGMMDDPAYVNRQVWKRSMYESAGITEWNNMIYTYHKGNEMDANEIVHVIEDRILPRMF